MTNMLTELLLLTGLGAISSFVLVLTRARFEPETGSLVTLINDCLPQTQCAQCGYAGCRPYAEAIVSGEAINRCPPGGNQTIEALANLLGRDPVALDSSCGEYNDPMIAVIREEECIGCTLCINACPVDAIVGAQQLMHTVIESQCTGCDLCREPCPVDCIDLIQTVDRSLPPEFVEHALPCINCGECGAVCPRDLQPQLLYWFRDDNSQQEKYRLDECIECGLCDMSCPASIPLTQTFQTAKARIQFSLNEHHVAQQTEQRYLAREVRLTESASQLVKRPSRKDRQQLLNALKEPP